MGRDDLVASAAYQPEPTAVAAARRFVRETLRGWLAAGPDGHGLVDDAVLLTSELVTNAVVHAGTPVQVTCKLAGGEVEVVVSDCHPSQMVPDPAGTRRAAERTGGRGLLLPAALASAWGVTYGRAAKAVWFRLGLTGAQGGAGQGNGFGEDPGTSLVGDFQAELAGRAALAAAFRAGGGGALPADGPHERDGVTNSALAGPGYQELLAAAAESARDAVAAEGACILLADEDGDLRPHAAAGSMTSSATGAAGAGGAGPPAAPSVLCVPFIIDGRVTGLLAAVSARPGRFGEAAAATLQHLADAWGPRLQRARLDQLEQVRRGRLGALADARVLLTGGLSQEEILAQAGRAVVPRLAPWCAVLAPDSGARLRPVYVRHRDDTCTAAVTGMIEQACEVTPPAPAPAPRAGAGPGWRWGLAEEAASPVGAAWCFPAGPPGDGQSLLVIGSERGDRLSPEVAALAGDVACRIGLALARSAGLVPAREPVP